MPRQPEREALDIPSIESQTAAEGIAQAVMWVMLPHCRLPSCARVWCLDSRTQAGDI